MKFISENNRLTVFLEGRIDTNNAAQVEKGLIEETGKSAGAGITSAKVFAPQIMDTLLRPVVIPNKDAIPYLLSVL